MRKIMSMWIAGCVGLYAALLPAVAQAPDPNAAAAAARAKQAEINRRNEEAAAKLRADQAAINQRNEAAAAKLRADQAALNRRNEEAARARNAAAAPTKPPPTRVAPVKPPVPAQTGQAAERKPATPSALRQLEYANRGQRERDHTFDGSRAPPNPVKADPAKKPNLAGTSASDFKPKPALPGGSDVTRARTNPPPSPTVTRSTAPVTTSAVRPPSPPAAAARPAPVVNRPAPVAARPAPVVVAKPAPVATKPAEEKKK